ncbi:MULTISPECIES: excinuclease ABC subunit UvrA [unclassified Sedimentibacter]|uniref:excinuclease ABC subunit UvrA n=1 Tax=unclassified Sedimentibacter TaxID=2649220 RepID=UPI0027DFE310|nr:excinuclease ABC subunit UvrA [Sedimentibacter sp. MB35-C1]WMJ75946.1 excinuclease ABC subunit UvrA [Sedimentibacter sp. MB35-C1]
MNFDENNTINIVNACENNLKNISVKIPKKQITIFTGVSGSGKSSLCIDTIAAESRRELNETFPSFVQQYLPKYGRPDVEKVENLPVTIIINQKKPAPNTRSTVGTYTDIQPFLRLLFSRVGKPFVGYSDSFSFNHPLGKCPRCDGLGDITDLDIHKLVDFNKCLNDEGVINFPTFTTRAWRWKRYAYSGLFDLNKKIKDYSNEELNLFLYSPQVKVKNPPSNWPKTAKFEGIYPRMYRSIISTKEGKRHQKILDEMVTTAACPECGGSRINHKIRSCKINGKSIADVDDMPIPEAIEFIKSIDNPLAQDIKRELIKRLTALVEIGLGYISLSRGSGTLSGGEAQRIKIAKYINSSLTDMVYVLDEPSVGLHPKDIELLKNSLIKLKNHGNTILIVEHHREIIKMADYVIDMGPKAGTNGGMIIFQGKYSELIESDNLTGKLLGQKAPLKEVIRKPKKWFSVKNAQIHNLKNVSVDFPLGVLTVIAGVAGSGKSSLMEYFQNVFHENVISISQKNIGVNLRSTPATYLDISDNIRKIFAHENKLKPNLFSFNSKGACPACGGKGIIISEMAFMDTIETVCDVCHGKRFSKDVLKYTYHGKNIAEVMDFTVEEAIDFFKVENFTKKLESLEKVGLGYLHLNQSMTTLSGGELQRVKLASQLNQKGAVFILDEPTDGLHLEDVRKLMKLFNKLVDEGNSLFLVEHSLEVMKDADYIIELGPGGGISGGNILFSGTVKNLLNSDTSVTRPYLIDSLP